MTIHFMQPETMVSMPMQDDIKKVDESYFDQSASLLSDEKKNDLFVNKQLARELLDRVDSHQFVHDFVVNQPSECKIGELLEVLGKKPPLPEFKGIGCLKVGSALNAASVDLIDCFRKKVGFFTPVKYCVAESGENSHGFKGKAVEFFDNYFFLGGKRANITKTESKSEGTGWLESHVKESWYMIALKVMSYVTLVIPAIMLIGKAIARSLVTYRAHDLFLTKHKLPSVSDTSKNQAEPVDKQNELVSSSDDDDSVQHYDLDDID